MSIFHLKKIHYQEKTYENVSIFLKKEIHEICGIKFKVDIIKIQNEEHIECEVISHVLINDTLIIKLCQDWG